MKSGKGLGAILGDAANFMPPDSDVVTSDVVSTAPVTTDVVITGAVISDAVATAIKNPRITVWSPVAKGILNALWNTQNHFSKSNEASNLLVEALAAKYPDLYKLVMDEMDKGN